MSLISVFRSDGSNLYQVSYHLTHELFTRNIQRLNLFTFSLTFKDYPINSAIRKLAELHKLSYKEFEDRCNILRWEIFQFHIDNNLFYKTWLFNQIGKIPNKWEEIPVLKKSDIQVPVKNRLSTGYTQRKVYIHNTSGSSGHPFFFAKDKLSHAMTWALLLDRYSRHALNYGKSLQARFFGIPLENTKYLQEKLKDILNARVRFPIFDLSDGVLEEFIQTFYRRKFDYIYGYTSSLVIFAKYLLSKGVILRNICPTLKVAISTSEVLSETDRALLINGFGVPVINEYGACELDNIAFEDEDFDWILNNENLFIEILDDNDMILSPGKEGRIIITSLFNKAMPFIRYEVGDIGSIDEKIKGNNHILKTLQGRTNDIAILPSGKKAPGLTFYYISKSLLEAGGGIKEFIIKQTSPSHFIYEYVAEKELSKDQKRKVDELSDIYLEPGIESEFKKVDRIDRTIAGKLKHFQKLF